LAEEILEEFKQKVTGLDLQPSGGGAFEITVNGKLVYSKLETGEFPVAGDVIGMLRELA